MANFSLRAKSLLALALACLLVLVLAFVIGWAAMQGIRQHFGQAYADNLTQLNRQRLLAPVLQDLAISQRLANSEITRRWLRQEDDPDLRELFFLEAESDRRILRDHAYFLTHAGSGNYYFNSDGEPLSERPRYQLDPERESDQWFYRLLDSDADYTFNINTDRQLGITRVWINTLIRDTDGTPLGLTGASLDLSRFLGRLAEKATPGVTPLLVQSDGAILAHPDPSRLAYNTAANEAERTLFAMLPAGEHEALRQAMEAARAAPETAQPAAFTLDGVPQVATLAYLPDLDWFVITALDLRAVHVVQPAWLWAAAGGLLLLLATLMAAFGYGVERLVLRPIRRLQSSAHAIAAGQYSVKLPPPSSDEIGDLSRSFGEMADQIRQHTSELENRVRARTRELEAANQAMATAQKKIGDSIDYASMIQRATLPTRQLTRSLGRNHFVLWRPRDVVGGDFYIFQADDGNYLLGIIDCAGHGVPGALMTMLAKAAVDLAIQECGPNDPAAILRRTDTAMRAMLRDSHIPRGLATNADAGLVYIDRRAGKLRYAGARISLYASDGERVTEHRGGRRTLGDRKRGDYENLELPLDSGTTYYLTTDGILDQAGGEHGYGFGNQRFLDLLRRLASLPLADQAEALNTELAAYQGSRPQRDDITLLSFRFDAFTDSLS